MQEDIHEGAAVINAPYAAELVDDGDELPAAVRLGEVIGWDRVAELAAERRESERRMSSRRRELGTSAGGVAVFQAHRN